MSFPGRSERGGLPPIASNRAPGEGTKAMLLWRYLLIGLGIGIFGSSVALVAYDVYLAAQLSRLVGRARIDENGNSLGAQRRPKRATPASRQRRMVVLQGIR